LTSGSEREQAPSTSGAHGDEKGNENNQGSQMSVVEREKERESIHCYSR